MVISPEEIVFRIIKFGFFTPKKSRYSKSEIKAALFLKNARY